MTDVAALYHAEGEVSDEIRGQVGIDGMERSEPTRLTAPNSRVPRDASFTVRNVRSRYSSC